MARQRVFLTGASGRIGSRVARLLLDKGYAVRALVHRHRPEGLGGDGFEAVAGDIRDAQGLGRAVDGCDVVCHLACGNDMFGPPVFEADDAAVFDNAIKGTFHMLQATREAGRARSFVFASSDAVFTAIYKRYDAPVTEAVEIFPRPGRFYAVAKAVGEHLCHYYQLSYGLPYTVIRVGWSLSPQEMLRTFDYEFWAPLADAAEREREALAPRLGDGMAVVEPVRPDGSSVQVQLADSDDIAAGIVLAIEKPEAARNQIFNMAGPAPFRYGDVVQKVADGLGRPAARMTVHGTQDYAISNEKAGRLLGYEPRHDIAAMIDSALAARGATS